MMFSPRAKLFGKKEVTPPASPTSSTNPFDTVPPSETTVISPSRASATGSFSLLSSISNEKLATWELVEVIVPPGPLGIYLNRSEKTAAVLEKFGPISDAIPQGALEKSGKIVPGSVLVGVNEHDFVAQKLSFSEIGRILSTLGDTTRAMRWRVPPVMTSVTPPAAPVIVESPRIESFPTNPMTSGPQIVTPVSPVATPVENLMTEKETATLLADKRSSSSAGFREIDESEVARELQAPPSPPSPSWVAKGLRSPGFTPTAPPSQDATAYRSGSLVLSPRPSVASPSPLAKAPVLTGANQITVIAPPGPLGLNLDGSIMDCAIVLSFGRMSDGSMGALERHGGIKLGSKLIAINGQDVTRATREAIVAKLAQMSAMERELTFQLPVAAPKPQYSAPVTMPATSDTFVEDLDKRRRIELQLVMKYDKTELKRKECWFLIDVQWMNRWIAFVGRQGPLPGSVSNGSLLEPGWKARVTGEVPGRPDVPRPNLVLGKDYRGVSPMVWCLYNELHGSDGAPPLARYKLDITVDPVAGSDIEALLKDARLKAAVLVKDMRDKCQVKVQ